MNSNIIWAFLLYFIAIQKNIFTGNQFQFINEKSPEMLFLNSMQAISECFV